MENSMCVCTFCVEEKERMGRGWCSTSSIKGAFQLHWKQFPAEGTFLLRQYSACTCSVFFVSEQTSQHESNVPFGPIVFFFFWYKKPLLNWYLDVSWNMNVLYLFSYRNTGRQKQDKFKLQKLSCNGEALPTSTYHSSPLTLWK